MRRNSSNPFNSKQGVSIVSMLVAASIGIIAFTGIITMITDVFRSQRSVQSKDAQREIVAAIRQLLSDPIICTASFGGEDPAGVGFNTITQIKDGATPPNVKYQTGVSYLNNLVTITGFTVRNFLADNASVSSKIGKAELVIDTKKIGSTIGGEQMKGTTLYLQTTLNAANKISQCYALGTADSLWQLSPTNFADIYYNGGNVGVGTMNPSSFLTIWGHAEDTPSEANAVLNLRTSNQGYGLLFGQSQSYAYSWLQTTVNGVPSDGALTTSASLAINPTGGNVGIGTTSPTAKLTVDSRIRVIGSAAMSSITNGSSLDFTSGDFDGSYSKSIGYVGDGSTSTNSMQLASHQPAGMQIVAFGGGDIMFKTDVAYGVAPERMIIKNSGNVGIGTTDPTSLLDLKGSPGLNGLYIRTTSSAANTSPYGIEFANNLAGAAHIGLELAYDGTFRIEKDTNNVFLGITQSGYVGIGTTIPSYPLHVNGTAYAAGAAGALSDVRHKKNIEDLADRTLDKLLQLHPVEFEWKNPKDKGMLGIQTGFIAQDVQSIFPGVILKSDDEEQTLGLKYNELVAITIKALKQFYSKWVDDKQNIYRELISVKKEVAQGSVRVEELEAENARLKNRLEKIEKMLQKE